MLDKISKALKLDVKYAVKGGFWLFTGHGIQIVSGFILAIAFANLLPKANYGTYQFIMSVGTIMAALTLSLNIPVKLAAAKGLIGALQFGFRSQLKWSIGILMIGGALAAYYYAQGNTTIANSFLIVGALTPLIGAFSLYKAFLLGQQKFKEDALLGFWLRPILLFTVIGALLITDDPFFLIFTYFATSCLSTGYLYFLTIHKYKLHYEPDLFPLTYSKHLSVIGIISVFGNHIEKLLIFQFLGATQLAVYAIAMLPTNHLLKLFQVAGDLFFPKFATRDYKLLQTNMWRKSTSLFLLSVVTVLVFLLTAPYLYALVFPNYPEAVSLAQMGIFLILTKHSNLYTQAFYAHKMQQELYFLRLSSLAIKILCLFLFIPTFGIAGAIAAFLVAAAYWTVASFLIFFFRRPTITSDV